MVKKDPILELLPFWLFIFLFKFSAGLHYTLLPVLGERVLPIWIVGIAIGIASLAQLILDVPAGFLLDRFGYIRLLIVSTSFFLFGAFALFFGLTLITYLITLFFSFLGWLFFNPGINAYTLLKAPQKSGGKYMGIRDTSASLGIVCATIGLVFFIHSPVQTIGLVLTAAFALSIFALMKTERDRASIMDQAVKHEHHTYYIRRHFINKILTAVKRLDPASSILAFLSLSGAIFYAVIWFVVPLVIASQVSSGVLSVGLGIFDFAVVVLGALLGKIADRHHKKMLIFIGLLLFGVMGIWLGFSLNIFFLLLGFLATAGEEMASTSLWSWLEELDGNHTEDGLVNGVIVFFDDLGWTIGPVAGGFLFGAVGPSFTIVIGAAPILAAWLFAVIFLKDKAEPALATIRTGSSRKPIRHRHKK